MSLCNTAIPSSIKLAAKNSNATLSFPCMVHRMLTDIHELARRDPALKYLTEIISWQNKGRAFRIHNKTKFETVIMPVWFCRLKHNSFLRQLSLFGFRKVYRETPLVQKGAWYHDMFVQGEPSLAKGIEKMGKTKSSTLTSQAAAPALTIQSCAGGLFGSIGGNTSIPASGQGNSGMESIISQSTLSYLKLKSSLAPSQLPVQPSPSHQSSGLVNMLSGAALPMPMPMTNCSNNSGLYTEAQQHHQVEDSLEPTPIPPGGFSTPHMANKSLQKALFDVLYATDVEPLDLDILAQEEDMLQAATFSFPWTA